MPGLAFGIGIGLGLGQGAAAAPAAPPAGPPLDGTTPIMAYASDRQLLTSYAGGFLTKSGSNVTALLDQSGNGRNFATDIGTPTAEVVGSDTAINFAGAASLVGPLISAVFATSTWVAMVVEPLTVDLDGNTAVGGNVVLGDKAEGGDLAFIDNGTSSPAKFGMKAIQYDGAYKLTPDVVAYPGNRMVVQFRKDATKLYARVNKGPEVSVAMGAFAATAYALMLGASGTTHFYKGRVYGLCGYTGTNIPASVDTVVDALMASYGIAAPPSVASYPDATNTGTTGTLTTGPTSGVTLSTPGQVYDSMSVTGGPIIVSANNVTISNCKVASADAWGIHILSGVTGCIISHCEVDGLGTGNTIGIAYEPDANGGDVGYCNIHNCEDGVRPSSNTNVHHSYIHDFASLADSGHYDGIEMDGGMHNIEISFNRIINAKGQTSCVQMNNNAGAIDSVSVHDNYLDGGSYVFYVDAHFTANTMTNINVSNNVMGTGSFGWAAINSATLTHAGNVDVVTGQKVDAIL